MAMDLSGLIQVGFDVLTTTVNATTRKITAQLGSVVGKTTDTDNAEWWQHVGFASRPPKPNAGKASAQAVVVKGGDFDTVLASQDLRGLELYGNLDHGETCLYAAGENGTGQARILLKKDGSVAIYTLQGNTSGGASCTIQVLPSGEIHLASPLGGVSIKNGKLTLVSASGSGMECSASGVNLLGQTIVANGSVVLGDASATGVATQASMSLFMTALVTLNGALTAFFNPATNPGIAVADTTNTKAAILPALAALSALAVAPSTYSLKAKAS